MVKQFLTNKYIISEFVAHTESCNSIPPCFGKRLSLVILFPYTCCLQAYHVFGRHILPTADILLFQGWNCNS